MEAVYNKFDIRQLKEFLQGIQCCTEPVQGHTDPLSVNDCWKSVWEIINSYPPSDKVQLAIDWCDAELDQCTIPAFRSPYLRFKSYLLSLQSKQPERLCDGCNVREPWEHRCHGERCDCTNPVCMERQGKISHEELMKIISNPVKPVDALQKAIDWCKENKKQLTGNRDMRINKGGYNEAIEDFEILLASFQSVEPVEEKEKDWIIENYEYIKHPETKAVDQRDTRIPHRVKRLSDDTNFTKGEKVMSTWGEQVITGFDIDGNDMVVDFETCRNHLSLISKLNSTQ